MFVASAADPAPQGPSPAPGDATRAIAQHNCLLKMLSQCNAAGTCVRQDAIKGEKLPVKFTVDFETGILAGVDPDGWVNATRIVSLARAGDQLMLQGIDNAVAWQMLIHEDGHQMSLSMASADGSSVGFGDCTLAKEP
jgi:hypothetical protein